MRKAITRFARPAGRGRHCLLDLLLEGLKGIFNAGILAYELVLVVDRRQCGHQTPTPLQIRFGVRILASTNQFERCRRSDVRLHQAQGIPAHKVRNTKVVLNERESIPHLI
ncbi:hypothetical protein [Streptomyces tubercidicus]